jgi:hypothetical protein
MLIISEQLFSTVLSQSQILNCSLFTSIVPFFTRTSYCSSRSNSLLINKDNVKNEFRVKLSQSDSIMSFSVRGSQKRIASSDGIIPRSLDSLAICAAIWTFGSLDFSWGWFIVPLSPLMETPIHHNQYEIMRA